MGRYKTYNEKTLPAAVHRYFKTITRQVTATEMVPTGAYDKYGHEICTPVVIKNSMDKEVKLTDYIEPPTVAGLCDFLGISTTTWETYSKTADMQPAVQFAKDKMLAYLSREMLTRPGKDTRGIEFNLRVNYGIDDKAAGGKGEDDEGVKVIVDV